MTWKRPPIVGVDFRIVIDFTYWEWLPVWRGYWKYCGGFHWLCFMTWTTWKRKDKA